MLLNNFLLTSAAIRRHPVLSTTERVLTSHWPSRLSLRSWDNPLTRTELTWLCLNYRKMTF